MKAIKLSGIFLLLVGLIFCAMNLNSWLSKEGMESDFSSKDKLDISKECDDTRKKWQQVPDWNMQVYKKLRANIDQSKNMKLYSASGYNVVNNTLRETSANKLCESYKKRLAASNYNHAQLCSFHSDARKLIEAEKMESDARLNQVLKIHAHYMRVYNFARSSHPIRANYDTVSTSWNSFESLQQRIINQATSYKKDPMYSEISQIPGFEAALDEAALKSSTDKQRKSFYADLEDQIISFFNQAELDQNHADKLRVACNRLGKECNEMNRLLNFMIEYNKNLKQKNENI